MQNLTDELTKLAGSQFCRKRGCPTLYKDKAGNFYIQGYVVSDAARRIPDLPDGETLVQIDGSLLANIRELPLGQ